MAYHGSNGSGLGFSSAYRGALDKLSGGRLGDVEDLLSGLAPAPREISGAELALQFFSNMAANASQPGSTVLSSAASAVKPTADEYIRQVEANRKDQAALGPLAISLAKSLKPVAASKSRMDVILKNVVDDPETLNINERMTSILQSSFDPKIHIPKSAYKVPEGFVKRTLYKNGAEVQVLTQSDLDKYTALDYNEVKPAITTAFGTRTLYKDGAETKVYSQAELDTRKNDDWSEEKPAITTAFGTRTLYKDGAEIKVYSQNELNTRKDVYGWSEEKPAITTAFGTRTLYKDGAKTKVYSQAELDTRKNDDWSEVEPASTTAFGTRTLYKDGAEIKVYSQAELDTRKNDDWSEVKPASTTAFGTRTIYKDGAETKVYSQAELDARKNDDWSEVKPADTVEGLKPNAYERIRNEAITVATQIQNNEIELINGKLPANILSTLQLDSRQIKEVKKITINNQDGSTTELLKPGINMREVIAGAYGEEVAKLMYGDTVEKSDTVETKNNYINPLNIAGIDFNTIGGKGAKLSTAEASSLANAKNSANSLNKAFNLYFENGEYNRKRAILASQAATSVTENPTLIGRAADIFAAVTDQKARSILQEMSNSIEIILRVRSGAAVPDSEVIKYQKIYMPNSLDSPELARAKLQKLAAFVADTYDGLAAGRFARIENDQYDRNSDDPLKRSRYIYNDSSHGIVDQNTGEPLDLRTKYSTDSSGADSAQTPTILSISNPDANGNVVVTLSNGKSLFGPAENFE